MFNKPYSSSPKIFKSHTLVLWSFCFVNGFLLVLYASTYRPSWLHINFTPSSVAEIFLSSPQLVSIYRPSSKTIIFESSLYLLIINWTDLNLRRAKWIKIWLRLMFSGLPLRFRLSFSMGTFTYSFSTERFTSILQRSTYTWQLVT